MACGGDMTCRAAGVWPAGRWPATDVYSRATPCGWPATVACRGGHPWRVACRSVACRAVACPLRLACCGRMACRGRVVGGLPGHVEESKATQISKISAFTGFFRETGKLMGKVISIYGVIRYNR